MKTFNKLLNNNFKEICKLNKLFRANISGIELWDLYLKSFTDEENPVFRDPESTVHNCNHCKNFIRRYGNIVSIDKDNNIITMFDLDVDGEYKNVTKILAKAIKESSIKDVFFETFNELNSLPYESCSKSNDKFRLGFENNSKMYSPEEAKLYGVVKPGEIRTFSHFFLDLPKKFVDKTGKSVESIMGDYRSAKEVFKRAMDEISLDTYSLVIDLINQGSLLDGTTHLHKIEKILPLKKEYDKLPLNQKDNWCWNNSYGLAFAKFRNELIGVLCSELSQGEELNKACKSWNKRVDPANYMKATAPITQKQIDQAKEFVVNNGYEASFNRRLAVIEDIKASEIKHINSGDGSIESVSIFDNVKSTNSRHKRNEFKGVEEVSIDKFMKDILPGCNSVEAFLENNQEGNLVTLTTSTEDSKPIFKWNNNYSWTFNGNLAGKSMIKESVKSQGGKVDGVLRFSIMWAEDSVDNSDLDAHCIEPGRFQIYYSDKISRKTGGNLDIDITRPQGHKKNGKNVVENIAYPSLSRMENGTYKFFVRQFSARNSKGFKAEIEFNGEIYSYSYNMPVKGDIQVAEVTLKDGEFSIKHILESSNASKEMYGLETKQFHKVNLVCVSPNHWGENNVGNKHYFFMLDKCVAENKLRSFHNENLLPELAEHRKVLEVLGATNMIDASGKQLSGLGFNSTVKDELILRLKGNFKRVIKVKF